jgi:threonine dehydrogenase-like Zn-dependent dehydrogenase
LIMTTPAVVLTANGQITLQDRPRPTLRPDQVLVEVELCGICGSDLHASQLPQVYRGGCILGHESTGRVAAVGDGVADWAVGQRVAVNPNGNVDGTCAYCRSARQNFCRQATLETARGLQADGALAPVMAAFPGHLRRIPDDLGTLEAAWVEPTATALRAVKLAGELAGRTVLVTGGGPIGQLACRLAHLSSPAQILLKEITVRGSYIYTDEFDRAIDLLATRQIAVADLTTVISPLADALTAFDALRAGQIMKALIAPGNHQPR